MRRARCIAGAHASGCLWAAVAWGSLLGTFALAGTPSLRRVRISYSVVGLSAHLAWPLAHALAVGILLIGLTGFVEGPAYSGTIALRRRQTGTSPAQCRPRSGRR
jgi:hypothetical protein